MLRFFRKHTRKHSGTAGRPVSGKELLELSLLSAFFFVLAALFVEFLLTLISAILLRRFSIPFTYSLFDIGRAGADTGNWTEERAIFIYATGVVICFLAGLFLIRFRFKNWKVNLARTWLAFLLIATLPAGMFAGIFFYDEFGIAYFWLFENIIVRILVALVAMGIMVMLKFFWIRKFLKTAYRRIYFSDPWYSRVYMQYAVIFPWMAGTLVLAAFGLPRLDWFWMTFVVSLGLILLPVYHTGSLRVSSPLKRSAAKIFTIRYPVILIILVILLLWGLSLL